MASRESKHSVEWDEEYPGINLAIQHAFHNKPPVWPTKPGLANGGRLQNTAIPVRVNLHPQDRTTAIIRTRPKTGRATAVVLDRHVTSPEYHSVVTAYKEWRITQSSRQKAQLAAHISALHTRAHPWVCRRNLRVLRRTFRQWRRLFRMRNGIRRQADGASKRLEASLHQWINTAHARRQRRTDQDSHLQRYQAAGTRMVRYISEGKTQHSTPNHTTTKPPAADGDAVARLRARRIDRTESSDSHEKSALVDKSGAAAAVPTPPAPEELDIATTPVSQLWKAVMSRSPEVQMPGVASTSTAHTAPASTGSSLSANAKHRRVANRSANVELPRVLRDELPQLLSTQQHQHPVIVTQVAHDGTTLTQHRLTRTGETPSCTRSLALLRDGWRSDGDMKVQLSLYNCYIRVLRTAWARWKRVYARPHAAVAVARRHRTYVLRRALRAWHLCWVQQFGQRRALRRQEILRRFGVSPQNAMTEGSPLPSLVISPAPGSPSALGYNSPQGLLEGPVGNV